MRSDIVLAAAFGLILAVLLVGGVLLFAVVIPPAIATSQSLDRAAE